MSENIGIKCPACKQEMHLFSNENGPAICCDTCEQRWDFERIRQETKRLDTFLIMDRFISNILWHQAFKQIETKP